MARFVHVLLCATVLCILASVRPAGAQKVKPCEEMETPRCNRRNPFRTLNGECNNLRDPFRGAALTPFSRLLEPDYADGKSEPREAVRARGRRIPLPNARNVSLALFPDIEKLSGGLTHMTMTFGQFLAHDITLAEQPEDFTCDGSCQPDGECFGIPANKTGDPAFPGDDGVNCIILRRNKPCDEEAETREQVNLLTSYIDASHIYGNNEEESNDVRDLEPNRGLLRTMVQDDPQLEDLLPPANPHTTCRTSDMKKRPCFLTGDFRRNNEIVGLNSMHTIWVREHNRIARELAKINRRWAGDLIFEETRRIIGAMMQHITYNEFLPAVLGDATMKRFDLTLKSSGRFTGYSERVDASISNSLAAAALRFGHSLIRNEFRRLGEDLSEFPAIPTKEFLNPEFLYETENGGVDSIIRGMANDEANEVDGNFARAILRFHPGDGGANGPSRGDLLSLNIQRGREHGLPSYSDFLNELGLGPVRGFPDLKFLTPSTRLALRRVYDRVEDIDLFVGGILEKHEELGPRKIDRVRRPNVGPTFRRIIATNFRRLRFGDRFWYENDLPAVRFTVLQLRELRKASLARIICDNSDDISQIQPQVLRQKSFVNHATRCARLPSVNLGAWRARRGPGNGVATDVLSEVEA